jgi:hypothetical protein
MYHQLIKSISLLSDDKSVQLGIDNALYQLWIMAHFKEMELQETKIFYQETPGHRARKGTIYKKHWLKKKIKYTVELIQYLDSKFYTLSYFELYFTNNWRIKIVANCFINIYTNSTTERNNVIDKLIAIAGLNEIKLSELENNNTYYLHYTNPPNHQDSGIFPDEFWSKEQIRNWMQEQQEPYLETEIKAHNVFDNTSTTNDGKAPF